MRFSSEQMQQILSRTRPPRTLAASVRNSWYRIKALSDRAAEVYIYDFIGDWGVSADDFVRQVSDLNVDQLDVRINSEGGDIWDGVAIYNALKSHRASVATYADGIAASAASIIFSAGDRRVTRRASRVMVHRSSTIAYGNAAALREVADLLEQLDNDMAGIYASTAGGTVEQWLEAMDAETWYSAKEAVDVGLATDTEDKPSEPMPADDPMDALAECWKAVDFVGTLKGVAA